MSRITACLNSLSEKGVKALIPYIVAGDPTPQLMVPLMHALVEKGADILEIGVPFSDPAAEGPIIQLAHERALANDTGMRTILQMVKTFREQDVNTPIVLMGYANPIEYIGYTAFADAASKAGVDGILTVDIPPEEANGLDTELKRVGIDNIFLISPTTSEERIGHIIAAARGFLYYVSLKGVTGAGHLDINSVAKKLSYIKSLSALPVAVGFGINDAASASAIAEVADAVVVGSALVDRIYQHSELVDDHQQLLNKATQIIADMRQAMDAA